MISTAVYFAAGLTALLIGAALLVNSSSRMAVRFGVPSIFIGVTVVAFATSAPEVAVSLDAVSEGRAELALGNVLGSNIANILLILGLSALIAPIAIQGRIIRLDIPLMIGVSVIVFLMALDGLLQPAEGGVLLALFAAFIAFQIYQIRTEKKSESLTEENLNKEGSVMLQLVLFFSGLALLVLGAHWLVESSVVIASYWGLSELVIGLTVIAIGTSLPEVATSVLAAWQTESDLSVGNVIGSNIFNLLLVLGLASVFSAEGLVVSGASLALDFPFMIAVSIACLPIFFTGYKIARWEGAVFLGYYAAYLSFLVLDATGHEYLPLFNTIMALFVIPITVLTLLIIVFQSWKNSKN